MSVERRAVELGCRTPRPIRSTARSSRACSAVSSSSRSCPPRASARRRSAASSGEQRQQRQRRARSATGSAGRRPSRSRQPDRGQARVDRGTRSPIAHRSCAGGGDAAPQPLAGGGRQHVGRALRDQGEQRHRPVRRAAAELRPRPASATTASAGADRRATRPPRPATMHSGRCDRAVCRSASAAGQRRAPTHAGTTAGGSRNSIGTSASCGRDRRSRRPGSRCTREASA